MLQFLNGCTPKLTGTLTLNVNLKKNTLLFLIIIAYFTRWNVRRKWKQSVDYDAIGDEDLELDEAYLDELEQQVSLIFKQVIVTISDIYNPILGDCSFHNLSLGHDVLLNSWNNHVRRVGRMELFGLSLFLCH